MTDKFAGWGKFSQTMSDHCFGYICVFKIFAGVNFKCKSDKFGWNLTSPSPRFYRLIFAPRDLLLHLGEELWIYILPFSLTSLHIICFSFERPSYLNNEFYSSSFCRVLISPRGSLEAFPLLSAPHRHRAGEIWGFGRFL